MKIKLYFKNPTIIIFCFFNLFLLYIELVTTSTSLYDEDDKVVRVDHTNFTEVVYNKPHAWIFQFYMSWCGHCQIFSKFYKQLADSIRGWDEVVKVAAMNCADSKNRDICQSYGIEGYPTVLGFLPNTTRMVNNQKIEHFNSVDKLKNEAIKFLTNNNLVPRFKPITGLDEVWKNKIHAKIEVILFEATDTYLGRQLILDLRKKRGDLTIYRYLGDPAFQVEDRDASSLPSMCAVHRKQRKCTLMSKDEMYKLMELERGNTSLAPTPTPTRAPEKPEKPVDDPKIDWNSDNYLKVNEHDLISSLSYSLNNEIPLRNSFSPDQLETLKAYIQVLAQFLPVNARLKSFLHRLSSWINSYHKETFASDTWNDYIKKLQEFNRVLPYEESWVGCRGSTSIHRGYPCGLWLIFHSLTVNAALEFEATSRPLLKPPSFRRPPTSPTKPEPTFDPVTVFKAIRSYVGSFFGCQVCVGHFLNATTGFADPGVLETGRDLTLYLWTAHNKANTRLKKSFSEDPAHPKTIFPNAYQCPACHPSSNSRSSKKKRSDIGGGRGGSFSAVGDRWNGDEVYRFLLRMYDDENVVKVPDDDDDGTRGRNGAEKPVVVEEERDNDGNGIGGNNNHDDFDAYVLPIIDRKNGGYFGGGGLGGWLY